MRSQQPSVSGHVQLSLPETRTLVPELDVAADDLLEQPRLAGPALPCPETPEPGAVPADHGRWLNDRQRLLPAVEYS